jgi:isopentenyl-diphosphate delta-isomerase
MEMIVLVDAHGRQIGTAPKLASHHARTPLHRAFSCYIFDAHGRFLVTRRALIKKVWPGVWTNSVCGHPAPGESFEAAIQRRAQYELGLTLANIQLILPHYRYQTPPFNGIIENEICPVFTATATSEPQPNPGEVEEYTWTPWPDYAAALTREPDKYSYWAKDQYPQLMAAPAFRHHSTCRFSTEPARRPLGPKHGKTPPRGP